MGKERERGGERECIICYLLTGEITQRLELILCMQKPGILVLHGLQSTSRSSYSTAGCGVCPHPFPIKKIFLGAQRGTSMGRVLAFHVADVGLIFGTLDVAQKQKEVPGFLIDLHLSPLAKL